MREKEKKYLDILPPQKIDRDDFEKMREKRERKVFLKRKFFWIFLSILIGGSALFYFKFQKVEIEIWPVTEKIRGEKEIIAKRGGSFNLSSLVLPALLLEEEKRASQKFPASYVTQERKAEGIIRVYNAYSTTPLTLRAQTRFLSDRGKLFRSFERITIPGKRYEKGKWIPGSIDVKVRAVKAGKEYNIPPSKFSLPGLAGTNLYTLVYGESFEPMKGGFSGKGHLVLAEDMERAEKVLREKLEKANVNYLHQKALQEGFILLEETITHQVLEATSSEEVGNVSEEFEFSVRMKTTALALEREKLEKLAQEIILSQMEEGKMFWPETLKVKWEIKKSDMEKGEVLISLEIFAKISEKIEKNALLEVVAGKSIQETFFILKNQFEKIEIKTTPFWLRKIPKDPERIEIKFILD